MAISIIDRPLVVASFTFSLILKLVGTDKFSVGPAFFAAGVAISTGLQFSVGPTIIVALSNIYLHEMKARPKQRPAVSIGRNILFNFQISC